VPEGIEPVADFELNKYLGTWYEVARMDHSFERGLQQVTAQYTLREDGGIDVVNRGYNQEDGEWDQANGKAYFVGKSSLGHLKVSFCGPFYASYVIFELDKQNYQYALITGPDRSYMWILSRQKELPEVKLKELLEKARSHGFDTDSLIFVTQM
jgi:apolipoprotein D and lipocalin family protein